jgi:polysaccharide biosynthesis/export protein
MKRTYVIGLCALVVLGLCNVGGASAQDGGSLMDLEKLSSKPTSNLSQMLTAEQVPTGDVVLPDIYVMGPGDVISYQTTGIDFTEKLAIVSPENTIMLERFGVVDVNGMTLQMLRSALKEKLKQRSPGVEVFLSLRRPRLIYVSVKGNVPFPGTYAVPASFRVSTLLMITRQPWLVRKDVSVSEQVKERGLSSSITATTESLLRSSPPPLSPYALRNIVVRHRKGVTLVDLARAELPDGAPYDPHLREGDVITVPFDPEEQATISISGAVVTPATLVYKEGDRASLLLAAAGGPTSEADLDRVTLVQSGGQGKITLKTTSDLRIEGEDPILEPGSSIIVEKRAVTGVVVQQGVVEVYGEVNEPGTVIIKPGVTRLSEVIAKAGGVKSRSSLSLSYIVRPEQKTNSESELLDDSYRRFMYSDLKLEDTLRYKLDQRYRLPYVSCDIKQALTDTASQANITMQTGDIIVIEPTPNRVFVYGQVNRPGYVTYVAGKTLEWYVQQAGGFATGAEEGRSRIIKGRTQVWVEDDDAIVEPGDEIYVPRPPDIPAAVEIQTYAVIAGVVSALTALTATIIAIVR